ncbi:hypothetical protein [Algicella marina]|uniref:Uncharacterized protein n=1 Tax=Algicella marina TaxID=2683284 RepID=A0A6P1SWQ8_9RHOB|nr:hypothetical protein [Algicella marina]QHQ33955.1 hypothetical protein GO499_01540 [Algicella marina]
MDHLENPIAALAISTSRRIFGAAVLCTLGAFLAFLAVTLPEGGVFGRVLLGGLGALFFWWGAAYYRATEGGLVLTEEGVFESTGEAIIPLTNIRKVDRSFFAFKPSNGFLIEAKAPMTRRWKPGLYWRFGRKVGVGGATPGKAARDFADVISLMLTERGAELIAEARRNS